MNKDRRNRIGEIMALLHDLNERIYLVEEDEQDAFENLPEGLQTSDRSQAKDEVASTLENARSSIDDALGHLEEASLQGQSAAN